MRGADSFDGKMSGNRQMVDRYNEAKGKKPAKGQKKPKPTGGESGGVHEMGGHDEIKQVVAEHGPAHSHHVHKTPDGYHSVTHHEDGHVHHADHGSLEEAHALAPDQIGIGLHLVNLSCGRQTPTHRACQVIEFARE